MAKIKRSEFKTFIDTTPATTPTWSLLAQGISSGTINYNPKTSEETFIDADSATVTLDSYAPNMPVEAIAINGDAAFEYIDGLRKNRAVLSDAETEIVNVWLYETATGGAYPAEKQAVSIQIDTFGGDGGTPAKINFTINYLGDAVKGTFNPGTLAFVAD